MRNQRRHIEPAIRHHVEHGLEIALRRPAHEADRIVLPLLFVIRIVSSRSIGTRHLKTQLLLIEIRARQFEPGDADQHDAAALAAHRCCLMHRLAAFGRRGDDDGIGAAPA